MSATPPSTPSYSSSSSSVYMYAPRPYSRLSQDELSMRRRSFSPSSTFSFLSSGKENHPSDKNNKEEEEEKGGAGKHSQGRNEGVVVAAAAAPPNVQEKAKQSSEDVGQTVLKSYHTQSGSRIVKETVEIRTKTTNNSSNNIRRGSTSSSVHIQLANNAPRAQLEDKRKVQQKVHVKQKTVSTSSITQRSRLSSVEIELEDHRAAGRDDSVFRATSARPPKAPQSIKSQSLPRPPKAPRSILRKASSSNNCSDASSHRDLEQNKNTHLDDVDDKDKEHFPHKSKIRIPQLIGAGASNRANRGVALKLFDRIESEAERSLPVRKTKSLSDVSHIAEDGRGIFAAYFEQVERDRRSLAEKLKKEEAKSGRSKKEKASAESGGLTSEEFVRRILLGNEKERRPVRRQDNFRRRFASVSSDRDEKELCSIGPISLPSYYDPSFGSANGVKSVDIQLDIAPQEKRREEEGSISLSSALVQHPDSLGGNERETHKKSKAEASLPPLPFLTSVLHL